MGAAPAGHPEAMARTRRYDVAASGRRWDEDDGRWLPAGEVHAWEQGRNETVCGLSLHRSRLSRFAGVTWTDVLPESGGAADAVRRVCPRCAAAAGRRGADSRPAWRRVDPRP
ncbi:hypothetical protein B9W64_02335 [Streptomyces sp. CS159]|nr:hypothetical protein B9W64_02335 [Streptomyces sp. CS159]